MRLLTLICFTLLPQPLVAQNSLDGDTFRDQMEGKTFEFAVGGQTYGLEIYLPGDRVIWDDMTGEECSFGDWFARDEMICFVYEYNPDVEKCWTVQPEVDGVHSLFFTSNESDPREYLMTRTDTPMMCTGPLVGS